MLTASGHRHHHGRFGIPVDFPLYNPDYKQSDNRTEKLSMASWPIKFIPLLHPNPAPLFCYLLLTEKLVGVLMLAS